MVAPVAGAAQASVPAQAGATANTSMETVERSVEQNSTTLSGAVTYQLSQADSDDKIPVILLFDAQPRETLELSGLNQSARRERMQSFTASVQADARDFLQTRQSTGEAADIKSFWVQNAMAVEATPETIRTLATYPEISKIVYDQPVHAADAPSPTISTYLNTLSKYGETVSPTGFERATSGTQTWSAEYIGADDVQERGITGAGVNVSVVDTGIDESHPALRGQVGLWKDFAGDYDQPADPRGHGTHVAGTIAGRTDAKRAVGVAPGATLFGARVLDDTGSGSTSDVMAGMEWSANNSADIVSASLGLDPLSVQYSGNETGVSSQTVEATNVTIYANGSGVLGSTTDYNSFKPSYVYVLVEPTAVNGSQIQDEQTQRAVMRNLSVSLRSPSGATPLNAVEAGWWFTTGDVPDEIAYLKFKPEAGTRIDESGNWSLTVENTNNATVSYRYRTTAYYPSNGSDQFSTWVDSLAETTDTVPVISAGNAGILGNRSVGSPGASEKALTVGAAREASSDVTYFSSRGPVGFGADQRPGVDIIAPGENVVSSYPTALAEGPEPYAQMDGTSMAAPHVSGTVALLLDANPNMTLADARQTLQSTAQPLPQHNSTVGAGMLDAWAAVNATTDLTQQPVSSESGVRELYAGIGNTSNTAAWVPRDPLVDPLGDAGTGPDLRAASPGLVANGLTIVTNESPANTTFSLYIDADRDTSTGSATGAEYRLDIIRRSTEDGLDLWTDAYEFDAANQSFEFTTNVSADPDTWGISRHEVTVGRLEFDTRNDSKPFDWYLTASSETTTDSDRYPDQGTVTHGTDTVTIPGTAVAWNATNGTPATDAPITFTLETNDGAVVDTKTVQTDAVGRARANFTVATNRSQYYDLRIEDQHGNVLESQYGIAEADLHGFVPETDDQTDGTHAVDQYYAVEPDERLSINIPVFNRTDTGLSPYTGTASFQINGFSGTESITKTVEVTDGIARTSVDFETTTLDDNNDDLDVHLSLGPNGTDISRSVGWVEVRRSTTAVRANPKATFVTAGNSATVSFQVYQGQKQATPLNESTYYRVAWITDQMVASLSETLPSATVERLRQTAAAGETARTSKLTAADRARIKQALEEQSTTIDIEEGYATPKSRGIGTFSVTPPANARFGLVEVAPDVAGSEYSVQSVVFVKDNLERYTNPTTEPAEEQRYQLVLESEWPATVDGDTTTVSDNFTAYVGLYDTDAGHLVDDATVRLYTTNGGDQTVTTSENGLVTVTYQSPQRNLEGNYGQQLLGITEGYQTADGKAVAETEYVFPAYDDDEQDDHDSPLGASLSYADGSVTANLTYRNGSQSRSGSTTVTVLKGDTHDLQVGYVDPNGSSTANVTVDDPTPPSRDERRRYELLALDETAGTDTNLHVSGLDATTNISGDILNGSASTVTVTVMGRNGDPIQGTTVRWSYVGVVDTRVDEPATFSELVDGETVIGTTDAEGRVSFTVDPAENFTGMRYSVGAATDNVSVTSVDRGLVSELDDTSQRPDTVPQSVVSLRPTTSGVSAGDNTTVDIVIDDADGGIDSFDATVNVSNTSVAAIQNATFVAGGSNATTTITTTNESVHFNASQLETTQSGSVTIATVTLSGVSTGATDLTVSVESMTNSTGANYSIDETGTTLNVSPSLPPVGVSDQPPTDPDGDGLFEDVNGDGEFNIVDVQALFVNRDDPAVADHPAAYDFTGNGEVNIVDVQALFQRAT